jgi:hypothetical protein
MIGLMMHDWVWLKGELPTGELSLRVMISESYVRTTPKPRPLSPMTTPNFVTLPTIPWTNMRELCLTELSLVNIMKMLESSSLFYNSPRSRLWQWRELCQFFEKTLLVKLVSSDFDLIFWYFSFYDQIDYQFPVCNTKWLKNGKLRKAILSAFNNISQRNFGIILILWCSFKHGMKCLSRTRGLSRSKFHS